MSELVSSAVVFYALHRLLAHVEHDVDGFVRLLSFPVDPMTAVI